MSTNSQVTFVFESMKSKIARAILAKCVTIPVIKYVSFDKIKLVAADFLDHEIPGIQLIDISTTNIHENARAKKTWQIALELVMRSDVYTTVTQNDLWNLENEILRKLFAQPQFGVKGVVGTAYIGTETDLHLLDPYYISRTILEVTFYEDLVRAC